MNKTFLKHLFSDKNFIIILFLLIIFSSVFAQLVPYFQGLIVDDVLVSLDMNLLITLCISIFFVLILDSVCRLLTNAYMINYGYKTAGKIQNEIFKNIIYKPYDFFEEKNTGDILYRTNTFVYDIGSYISKDISQLAMSVARMIMIFVFIFALEPYFALFLIVLYALIMLVIYLFSKILINKSKKSKDNELHRNSVILQNIEGLETYLAYNTNCTNLQNYNKVNSSYGEIRKKYYKTYSLFYPLIDFLVCIGTVLVYIVASTYTIHILQIGVIVSVLTYSSAMISPMSIISKGLASFFDVSVVLDEVLEFAGESTQNLKPKGKKQKTKNQLTQSEKINLIDEKIDIVCKNLSYKNDKNNTNIQQLNLKIKFGEKILLHGKYGSGKTSFSGLLCGLYKADNGQILFNEIEINNLTTESLANLISVTSDIVGVFKASVYENVKFAKPDASEKEIFNAIKFSGLKKVTDQLERGIKTVLDPAFVSEGDKQLISFARVILKNTPIVIVDEVVRDMGTSVGKKFLKNLKKFTQDKTLIYISENSDVDFEFDKTIDFNKFKK